MRYVWVEWRNLKRKLLSRKDRLIFLDLDGTLAPIEKVPEAVSLDPKTRHLLKLLASSPRQHVVMISGRSLKDLSSLVRLKQILYAGNHGLELRGDGLELPARAVRSRGPRRLIDLLAKKLKATFKNSYDGVVVEDKYFTLSVHFRNLPAEQRPAFNALIRFLKDKYKKYPLIWVRGKQIWEIKPRGGWSKGDVVLYLLRSFHGAVPVAIGDDVTDEDMFRVLKTQGVTIRVGYSERSEADYYLNSPHDVRVFLQKLCP